MTILIDFFFFFLLLLVVQTHQEVILLILIYIFRNDTEIHALFVCDLPRVFSHFTLRLPTFISVAIACDRHLIYYSLFIIIRICGKLQADNSLLTNNPESKSLPKPVVSLWEKNRNVFPVCTYLVETSKVDELFLWPLIFFILHHYLICAFLKINFLFVLNVNE